jgi:hypothetical protein
MDEPSLQATSSIRESARRDNGGRSSMHAIRPVHRLIATWQHGRHCEHPIALAVGPAIVDGNVATLDPAEFQARLAAPLNATRGRFSGWQPSLNACGVRVTPWPASAAAPSRPLLYVPGRPRRPHAARGLSLGRPSSSRVISAVFPCRRADRIGKCMSPFMYRMRSSAMSAFCAALGVIRTSASGRPEDRV